MGGVDAGAGKLGTGGGRERPSFRLPAEPARGGGEAALSRLLMRSGPTVGVTGSLLDWPKKSSSSGRPWRREPSMASLVGAKVGGGGRRAGCELRVGKAHARRAARWGGLQADDDNCGRQARGLVKGQKVSKKVCGCQLVCIMQPEFFLSGAGRRRQAARRVYEGLTRPMEL